MTATNDLQLARLFNEINLVPERVNRLDHTTTIEMIIYCFELQKTRENKYRLDYVLENVIPVLDNLLVYHNQKFQETKLAADIITTNQFHFSMEMILSWKFTPEQVIQHFQKTLFQWENKSVGSDYEKDIIKQIIQFFIDSDKTRTEINISDEIRPKLFEGLKPYFNPTDHHHLESILQGKKLPGIKLTFKCKRVDIGCVFGILCEKHWPKQIFNTETFVIDWIVKYFECYNSKTGQSEPLNGTTIKNYVMQTDHKEKYKENPKRLCSFLDDYK